MRRGLAAIGLAACGHRGPGPVTIDLDTRPGLSDLAVDGDGALWTVAERDRVAYRIVLDGDRLKSLDAFPIDGVPDGVDLEAMGWTPAGLRFGTEQGDETAQLLAGTLAGGRITTTVVTTFQSAVDRPIADNHGIESLCDTGLLGFEIPVERDGKRLAQLELDGTRYQVALTSDTGKISDLDCHGTDVLAIERHFGVSRLIHFTLGDAAAMVVEDLVALAHDLNFEGLARLPDGRIALVNDNQYKTIDGPSQLVILPAP